MLVCFLCRLSLGVWLQGEVKHTAEVLMIVCFLRRLYLGGWLQGEVKHTAQNF